MPASDVITDRYPALIDQGDDSFLGVDMRDPRTLPESFLNDARNLRFYDFIPQTRKCVFKPAWANRVDASASMKVNSWGAVYGSGVFRDPSSTEWEVVAADGLIWRSRPNNQPVSIPIPNGVTIKGNCTFVQAFSNLYCFRGQYLAPLRMADFDNGFLDVVAHWSSGSSYAVGAEVAYGPFISVASITRVSTTATVTTTDPHGYISGADITHSGAAQTEYNVRAPITVVDDSTYTYPVSGTPATPATGTITASNFAYYWKALGTLITLTSLTSAATTATATKNNHGFTTGQTVTIAGATQTEYNGTYTITVTGVNTFTYTFAGSGTSPATGTITARNSLTLAGQSPDSNPEAWSRVYNILPNADNALYVNNRLLVPTAFEPSSADNYATFSGLTLKKKDYIVATDYLDDIHFDFSNEFRINQGSEDEIVDLLKFNEDTVIVFKGRSWGVLSNVGFDLSNLSLDFRSQSYGLAARGAATLAGQDVLFMSSKRGVVSIRQTEQGKLVSIDVPLSAPIQKLVDRINWAYADQIRLENWNSCLYAAVPLDSTATQNNCILVHDFVSASRLPGGGWVGRDDGAAIVPKELFKMQVNGTERLLFLGNDGYVSLMEESDFGDQVGSSSSSTGLALTEVSTYALSRAYFKADKGQARAVEMAVVLQTWNPKYTLNFISAGPAKTKNVATDSTRSRTHYYRPFDAAAWVSTNVNNDFATPDREDYSVVIPNGGLKLGSGVVLNYFQESIETFRISNRQSRSFQIELSNTQGRVKLQALRAAAGRGTIEKGVLT